MRRLHQDQDESEKQRYILLKNEANQMRTLQNKCGFLSDLREEKKKESIAFRFSFLY